ncbi:metallophosphoesterase family protein [Mariprofundus ferrooxydans]|uniref:metallophosphoesterase family protein n=1 Tax=Mariprofundus ferrooxydans TaxID=314344 RepID=UPI0014319F6D|nr:metallophosphoesterase [Mariprofundus ferrooxydans]
MTTSTKIAIISDIHIGAHARCADLNPHSTESHVANNFIDKFLEFIKGEAITADYLVVSGDISTKCMRQEFLHAEKVILEIADGLCVKQDRVFFVPGNHDVDWDVLNLRRQEKSPEDISDLRIKQRYDPIKFVDFFRSRNSASELNGLFEDPYIASWDLDDVCFIGYNSAWHDEPEQVNHPGLVDPQHLNALTDLLKGKSLDEKVKIFITHHHLIPQDEPDFKTDFSVMQNVEGLLDILDKYRFDVVIHGHKHYPRMKPYDHGRSNHRMVVIAAGSFSAALGTHLDYTANMFHLLTTEGRHAVDRTIQGKLNSWAYSEARGWYTNKEEIGVNPCEPFGYYNSLPILYKEVVDRINNAFTTSDNIKWSKLLEYNSDLQYVGSRIMKALCEKIEEDGICEVHSTNDGFIFLKREDANV